MIVYKRNLFDKENHFGVPARLIWMSAIFMGVLASLPKILQLHITLAELLVDSALAILITLFSWYFNLSRLTRRRREAFPDRFFDKDLALSLMSVLILMPALILLCHRVLGSYPFQEAILMYEFRATLINLTIYLFLFLLYQSYIGQRMAIDLERERSQHLSAQYSLLKQQVNPHFLFNSLNTLKSMVEMGDSGSVEFILQLAQFYRNTLENPKNDLITMDEELKNLDAYLYLLKARFEDGLRITTQVGGSERSALLPPFTLQILLENCVKHNIVSLDRPLSVRICTENDALVVENNLQPKRIQESSVGVGLQNIRLRYQHLTDQEIDIEKGNEFFRVKLPLIYEHRHH